MLHVSLVIEKRLKKANAICFIPIFLSGCQSSGRPCETRSQTILTRSVTQQFSFTPKYKHEIFSDYNFIGHVADT